MPMEAIRQHFRIGLIGGPMIESHAVCRDKHARAVVAVGAMDEDLLRRGLPKQGEKLRELCGGGSRETPDWNGHKMNAQ